MKIKDLLKELQKLDSEKEIIINSDEPYIDKIEKLGESYCIYGTYKK